MSNDMFTQDRCRNCMLRGDYEKCKIEPCTVHESWYVKASREQMKKECLNIMVTHGGYDSIYAAIEALE